MSSDAAVAFWLRKARSAHLSSVVARVFVWIFVAAWVFYGLSRGSGAVLAAAFAIAPIWWYASNQRRRLKKGLLAGRAIATLPPQAETEVELKLNQLCTVMGIERSRVKVWLDRTNYSRSASIIEYGQTAHMLLSVGFLSILKSRPQEADAILAHELAHVRQRDSRLWLLAVVFARSTALFSLLSLGIGVAEILHHEYITHTPLTPDEGIHGEALLLNWAFYRGVRRSRWNSEYFADIGAVAAVGAPAVLSALVFARSGTGGKPRFFASHPSPEQRIKRLEQLLADHSVLFGTPSG